MSIEEHRSQVIEYRLKGKGTLDSWPVIAVEPGEVRTNMNTFERVAQIEEYIEAPRKRPKKPISPMGPVRQSPREHAPPRNGTTRR
jgi:hypothetical protein